MTEYKHHSPFNRVFVTEDGGQKIKKLQNEFDKFWKQVNRVADKCPEKFHAMKALQEACMWLTRATALQSQKVDGIECDKIIIDDPLARIPVHQKTIAETLSKYKEGDTIEIRNKPTIIFKKKT